MMIGNKWLFIKTNFIIATKFVLTEPFSIPENIVFEETLSLPNSTAHSLNIRLGVGENPNFQYSDEKIMKIRKTSLKLNYW